MLSGKAPNVPDKISKARLSEWYLSLSDDDRIKTGRYLDSADVSSEIVFFITAAEAALADENHVFAAFLCGECLERTVSDVQKFYLNETLIESFIGMKRYDDAKELCEANLVLFPEVSDDIIKKNGGRLPEKMACRNRYVDVIVGIESGYDKAFELLDRFLKMDMITEEDHALRKQSLRIHRLQRSFDGVYTYTYKRKE